MANEPRTVRRRLASERGAILIQVGVAIFVLSAFAMFIVDYGVLSVSRHQAQNAADAGALAGATALALDDFDDRSAAGPAKVAARSFAQLNAVWGEQPDVQMATDVRFYADAPEDFPASCITDDCIRVDVYRNQTRQNPLPMFFGWLVGLSQQGVRATATARAAVANASDCLKPWAVADKWAENNPVPNSKWTPDSTFDPTGPNPDVYKKQNGGDDPGTSYTLDDVGTELRLKIGHPDDGQITPGWFQALDLPCAAFGNGAKCYEENIRGCTSATFAVGDVLGGDGVDLKKENGNMTGPTKDGTQDLIDLDPLAQWDSDKKTVVNSCVEPPYSCSTPGLKQSPRIVAIPVFDTQQYWTDGGPGQGTVHVAQILGFFVDRLADSKSGGGTGGGGTGGGGKGGGKGGSGGGGTGGGGTGGNGNGGQKDVIGYLATTVGLSTSGGGNVAPSAAFLKTVQLVR
jgi:Flp pilus assembly protein TadG